MSGVVNFKSRHHFEGIQLDVRSGISGLTRVMRKPRITASRLDSRSPRRGNVLLSAGYTDRDVLWERSRLLPVGCLVLFHRSRHLRPGADEFAAAGGRQHGVRQLRCCAGWSAQFTQYSCLHQRHVVRADRCATIRDRRRILEHYWLVLVLPAVTYQEFVVNLMERKSFYGKFDFDVTDSLTASTGSFYITRRRRQDRSAGLPRCSWSPRCRSPTRSSPRICARFSHLGRNPARSSR